MFCFILPRKIYTYTLDQFREILDLIANFLLILIILIPLFNPISFDKYCMGDSVLSETTLWEA